LQRGDLRDQAGRPRAAHFRLPLRPGFGVAHDPSEYSIVSGQRHGSG
jgi:hypothetical protein